MLFTPSEVAARLARSAEAVCACYLSNGRRQGRYWVAMNAHRSPLADFTAPYPWLRNSFALLPGPLLWQIGLGEAYGLVVAYDGAGRAVASLHDATGRFVGGLANAEPYGGKLYLGTKWGHQLAVVDLPPP